MKLFKKKETGPQSLMGIDLGAGGVKLVELGHDDKRLRLMTYAFAELQEDFTLSAPEAGLLGNPKEAAEVLKLMIRKAGVKAKKANVALPSHEVFHTIISIPRPHDDKAELKAMIEAQVKNILPLPIKEMILDSTIIDREKLPRGLRKDTEVGLGGEKTKEEKKEENKRDKDHIRVLVSGAPRTLVEKYIALFKLVGIELDALETEIFALSRSLIGRDRTRSMIVDIGYERTNIAIFDKGIPYLHRSIKAGGEMVSKLMAKQMGVSVKEAEQAKLDLARTKMDGDVPPIIKDAIAPILHEIRYAIQLYGQQAFHEHSSVDKIILTGGSAYLPKIDELIASELNRNVYIGNPWARIATPNDIAPVLEDIGPRFSVGIGLAMKTEHV